MNYNRNLFRQINRLTNEVTGSYRTYNPPEPPVPVTDTVTITTQPQSITCNVGDTATFTIVAVSDDETATLSYQWQLYDSEWLNIQDATLSSYTAPTLDEKEVYYRCVVISDKGGTATSNQALLTVEAVPIDTITITAQPQSVSGNTGDVITLSVTASSDDITATLSYQWQIKNGSTYDDISGATSSTYTVPTTTAGTQRYRVVITSDKGGSATSNYADVTVAKPRQLANNSDYKIFWYYGASLRYATNSSSSDKISSTGTESDGAIFHVTYYGNNEYIIETEINGDTYYLAYESDMLYFTNADIYTWKDSNLSGTAGNTIMTSDGYYLVYNGLYLTLTGDTPTYIPNFGKQPTLIYESDFSSDADGWTSSYYYDSQNHWIYNNGSSARTFTKNLYSMTSSTPPEGAPMLPCTFRFTYTFNPIDLSNSADVDIKFTAYRRNPSMQQEAVTAKTVTVSTSGTTTGTDTFTLTSSYDGMWFIGIQVSMPATGYRENVAMSYFKLELIT